MAPELDPQSHAYWKHVALAAGGCAVMAAVTLLSFILFALIRFLCCCCGHGCCSKTSSTAVVARRTLWLTRGVVLLCLVLGLVGGILCCTASAPVTNNTRNLADTLVRQADTFVGNVTFVIDTIEANIPAGVDIDLSSLQDAEAQVLHAQTEVHRMRNGSNKYLVGLEMYVNVVGGVVIGLAALGALLVLLRRMPGLVVFLLLASVATLVLWVMSTASSALKTVSDDVCAAAQQSLTPHPNAYLAKTLKCPDSSDANRGLNTAMSTANSKVFSANTLVAELNSINTQVWIQLKAICARDPNASASFADCDPMVLATPPPKLPGLCLPFVQQADGNYTAAPGNCSSTGGNNRVQLAPAAIQAAYQGFHCSLNVSTSDPAHDPNLPVCYRARTYLPNNYYELLLNASSSVQALSALLPMIRDIFACVIITDTYAVLVDDVCPGFRDAAAFLAVVCVICACGLTFASFFICVFFRCVRVQPEVDMASVQYLSSTGSLTKKKAGRTFSDADEGVSGPIGIAYV